MFLHTTSRFIQQWNHTIAKYKTYKNKQIFQKNLVASLNNKNKYAAFNQLSTSELVSLFLDNDNIVFDYLFTNDLPRLLKYKKQMLIYQKYRIYKFINNCWKKRLKTPNNKSFFSLLQAEIPKHYQE